MDHELPRAVLTSTATPEDVTMSIDEYNIAAVQRYLATTPPPKITTFGFGWELPDISKFNHWPP